MNSLNWKIRDGLHLLRDNGRLNLLIALMCHSNARNRCWPSMRLLVKETGWSIGEITKAKDWLIEHGALELVDYDKRVGKQELSLPRRQHIYQLTGEIKVEDKTYHYFLLPDVSLDETSPSEISRDETEVIQDISKSSIEIKPLSAVADIETVSSDTVTVTVIKPKPSKPAKTPKPVKRLHTTAVKDELLPVLVKYGKGRTLESYTTSEFNILMKTGMSQVLTALQPLDDEKPIDAMELDAAFKWFKRQYKDASYPCGANTVAKMLSDYRAYVRNLKSPKPTLATPAIDGWLEQYAPSYADSIDITDVRLINGESK